VSASQVSIPVSQLTGDITIELGTGSTDTLNFSGGDLTLASGAAFNAHAQSTIMVQSGAHVGTTGTGTLSINSDTNLVVTSGGSLTTVDGGIFINAGLTSQSSGNISGILVSGGSIQSTGAGNVTLMGRGGDTGDRCCGVYVNNGGSVMGGTSGLLSITGTGGASSGNTNLGITVENTGAVVGSAGADVSLLGMGGGTAGSSFLNYGIYEVDGGTITAGGAGTVTVEGHSGNGGSFSSGIDLEGQTNAGKVSMITSSGGLITVKADSGTGTSHIALQIGDGSGPAATVTNPSGGIVLIAVSIGFGPN
jgi:hypothetical protein